MVFQGDVSHNYNRILCVGGLIFTIFFFFLVCALFCCLTPALYFQSNFNSINVTFTEVEMQVKTESNI